MGEIREALSPWALSPRPGPRRSKPVGFLGLRKVPDLGTLCYSFMEGPDRAIVHRSWGLYDEGAYYGSKFHFYEHNRVRNVFVGLLYNLAVLLSVMLLYTPPIR